MGIKAVVAAVVMAMGVTQAEAATFSFGLEYVGSYFNDVWVMDREGTYSYPGLSSQDDPWGIPLLWDGLQAGRTYNFYMTADQEGVTSCSLGKYDCSHSRDPYWGYYTPLFFGDEGNYVRFSSHDLDATVTVWQNWQLTDMEFNNGDVSGVTGDRYTTFRIVDLAPVPLPAPAALLPLGLGALALLRKRRRAG